jgi:hypothetical protein
MTTIEELQVREENFNADVSDGTGEWLSFQGSVSYESRDNLLGDQVSSVTTLALVEANDLQEVVQFDEDGNQLPFVNLEFFRNAQELLDQHEVEIDVEHHSINYFS